MADSISCEKSMLKELCDQMAEMIQLYLHERQCTIEKISRLRLEVSVNANWNKGRLFYPASSHSTDITEGKTINTEDYAFNHEPGNILSYKPVMKSQDFCSGPSDFIYHTYSRVLPVTIVRSSNWFC
jgi:hypothetical protein